MPWTTIRKCPVCKSEDITPMDKFYYGCRHCHKVFSKTRMIIEKEHYYG